MKQLINRLSQLENRIFLTDSGLETTLIYHHGMNLPCFAAFDLLKNHTGREILRQYFLAHAAIAREHRLGFVLESVTWRANRDWGNKLGYSARTLAEANRAAIHMLHELREELENSDTPMVVSGCLGPRGDGYQVDKRMSVAESQAYHRTQVEGFRDAHADLVSAYTLTYAEEAIGITLAAQEAGLPVAISFTTETDGRLPSGQTLSAAIGQVDAATQEGPAYYMINCAHPIHFEPVLTDGAPWVNRIRGIRANASHRSHAELDTCSALDAGDPQDLGARCHALRRRFPGLNVLGGCCGTDHRHVEAIARACKT